MLEGVIDHDYPSNFNRRRSSNIGIRAHDHDLLKFEVPIAPERVILNELDASERKYLTPIQLKAQPYF